MSWLDRFSTWVNKNCAPDWYNKPKEENLMKYSMLIVWSEEDQCYLVHLPEFNLQKYHSHGDTYEEAASKGADALEALVNWYKEEGKEPPSVKRSPLTFDFE